MESLDAVRSAFFDELEKIAASRKNMTVAQSRRGRRPMSVQTMLRKEKDGTLFKTTGGVEKEASSEEPRSVTFSHGPHLSGIPAKKPRRKGDVPDREGGIPPAKTEERQNVRATMIGESDAFPSPFPQPTEHR